MRERRMRRPSKRGEVKGLFWSVENKRKEDGEGRHDHLTTTSVARTGEFKFLKICVHWIFRFSWYMGLVCGCSKDCIPMVRFVPQDQQCEKDYFGV